MCITRVRGFTGASPECHLSRALSLPWGKQGWNTTMLQSAHETGQKKPLTSGADRHKNGPGAELVLFFPNLRFAADARVLSSLLSRDGASPAGDFAPIWRKRVCADPFFLAPGGCWVGAVSPRSMASPKILPKTREQCRIPAARNRPLGSGQLSRGGETGIGWRASRTLGPVHRPPHSLQALLQPQKGLRFFVLSRRGKTRGRSQFQDSGDVCASSKRGGGSGEAEALSDLLPPAPFFGVFSW